MLQRNLVCTGITRGKRLLVVIGQRKALGIAVHNDRPQRRYSGLLTSLKGRRGVDGKAIESKTEPWRLDAHYQKVLSVTTYTIGLVSARSAEPATHRTNCRPRQGKSSTLLRDHSRPSPANPANPLPSFSPRLLEQKT